MQRMAMGIGRVKLVLSGLGEGGGSTEERGDETSTRGLREVMMSQGARQGKAVGPAFPAGRT